MDCHGRVLAGSNRNSFHEEQNVRKVSSRLSRGTNGNLQGSNETLVGSAETLEGSNLSNLSKNHYKDGFHAWKMLKQISAQIDSGGPSVF